jgi:hypothetical protein
MTWKALRCLVLLGFAVAASACEGLVSPLAGPSAFRPPVTTTTPSPVPSPTPGAPQSDTPNFLGSWTGTATISAGLSGLQATNICVENWFITTQGDGAFSGTFQSNGGITVDCARTGTISGTFLPGGAISSLVRDLGANTGCAKLSATPYSGAINATNSVLTATATERLTCGSGSTTAVVNRTIVVTMNKR